jgi:protoporphyrinogen oxidase
MAAAFALTQHSDRFHVTVFDKQGVCGGMATSSPYVHNGTQVIVPNKLTLP